MKELIISWLLFSAALLGYQLLAHKPLEWWGLGVTLLVSIAFMLLVRVLNPVLQHGFARTARK
jgi:hypothetical protein